MIVRSGKELVSRYFGLRPIAAVYKGLRLVWEAVRSCYGSGRWRSDKPWKSDDRWKGNA